MVAHNHLRGAPPGFDAEDLGFSCELRSAGRRRGVEVVDHLIVSPRAWVSLRRLRALP